METTETTGQRLRRLRLKYDYTQAEIAEKLGYQRRSVIGKIERGEAALPYEKAVIAARMLMTTPEYLLGEDHIPVNEQEMLTLFRNLSQSEAEDVLRITRDIALK